jgi:type I restriction enzyme, R subunit
MSNFSFLGNDFPFLYGDALEAEKFALTSPRVCAILSRGVLEKGVHWLYDHDSDLYLPHDSRLSALIHDQGFKNLVKGYMFREINIIRKVGNNGAHGIRVEKKESVAVIKNLFRFLGFIAHYYGKSEVEIPRFDMGLIPDGNEVEKSRGEIVELEKRLNDEIKKGRNAQRLLMEEAHELEDVRSQLSALKVEIKERKVSREKSAHLEELLPLLVSEADTRKLFIDLMLKDSGWESLREGYEIEYEVEGMPISTNPSGVGYADYVLWGDDSLPLGVIEAKKCMVDARKGRHQAELYADCLEKMTGRRPVIFYTNGFETYIWDDEFAVEREISGFYSKDQLQLHMDRRGSRLDLREFKANPEIAGRPYQLEAIKRVAESFVTDGDDGRLRSRSREALLVMATGSGKTRTAVSIVDMMTKCNWVKRVLFLADRSALVTQAKNAFKEMLPNLTAMDLTKEKRDDGARLVFSTYPTIMNRIDSVKVDGKRAYGPGYFDLIIIDEAHRSVYQKYGAIFEYFDSLLIGLTATPKTEIDHNTYGLFGIEDDNPTFAYELNQAVEDGFLVPAKAIIIPLKFPDEGIKYSDLSEDEKREYEEKFGDPSLDETPDYISGSAVNSWLFNKDTVDKVLDYLMENGIKVEGGDKLGKTIVFAKNHKHGVFIEERFNKNYPEYGGKFLRVIDNYETKAQDLLEKFVDVFEENDPQIAVSVDMMDTGVDAPRVVNLVFFKLVRSVTKFWQMIGRGTRLCGDLFGPGEDKTHFFIFDFCKNFDFFQENPEGVQGRAVKSLTQQTFESKLELALLIRGKDDSTKSESQLAEEYISELHDSIENLDSERFVVKRERRFVTEFKAQSRWSNLSEVDNHEINSHLSKLILPKENDHELSRRFDVFILKFQIALLSGTRSTESYVGKIHLIATSLKKKLNIPKVKSQEKMLNAIQSESF